MGTSKFTLILMLCILSWLPLAAITNSYTLEEALKKKLVTATISGHRYETSSYYGKCIGIKLHNTTSQALSINVESGRRLNSDYDSVQDMLITQSERFALLPSQTQEFSIYAMCCEQHNQPPVDNNHYNLGAMADASLVQLARLIEQLQAQDYAGQHAVWVLSDGADPNSINSSNPEITKALREFVINVVKAPKAAERDPGFIYDYSYPQTDGVRFTLEGEFTWEMPYQSFVSLYIYDNSGNRVCVIFQDAAFPSGLQTYNYKVTSDALKSGGLYWIRMKQNSKTIKELAVTMD